MIKPQIDTYLLDQEIQYQYEIALATYDYKQWFKDKRAADIRETEARKLSGAKTYGEYKKWLIAYDVFRLDHVRVLDTIMRYSVEHSERMLLYFWTMDYIQNISSYVPKWFYKFVVSIKNTI